MDNKTIGRIFNITAILLMIFGLYKQFATDERGPHISFWLGLLVYSIGTIIVQYKVKKEKEGAGKETE